MACTLVLSPVFEPHFHCNSYGYRPKRSAQDAVICINSFLKQGYIQVDDPGLSKFFDTIPHARSVDKLIVIYRACNLSASSECSLLSWLSEAKVITVLSSRSFF